MTAMQSDKGGANARPAPHHVSAGARAQTLIVDMQCMFDTRMPHDSPQQQTETNNNSVNGNNKYNSKESVATRNTNKQQQ